MTLGEFITKYRAEHEMSVRAFARMVDLSPQQILNIERGIGSDGKPMQSSTMKTYKRIADAIGMDEIDFLNLLNDSVRINPSEDDKNMPIVVVDGHKMLDLSVLTESQRSAISLLLQADQQALSSALPDIEILPYTFSSIVLSS